MFYPLEHANETVKFLATCLACVEGGESGFPPKQNTRARTKSRQLHTLFGLCNLDIIWIFYEQYPYVICIYSYLFFSSVAWIGG